MGADDLARLPSLTMRHRHPPFRSLTLVLLALVVLDRPGSPPVPSVPRTAPAEPEPAVDATAPAEGAPLGPEGEAVVVPAGAQASGLDRLAQLLTAPRPLAAIVGPRRPGAREALGAAVQVRAGSRSRR